MQDSSIPLGEVSASATRYSEAATALSKDIVELEAYLNSLAAKREVTSDGVGELVDISLKTKRGRDGKWAIYHCGRIGEPARGEVRALGEDGRLALQVLLRDTSVETKLRAAPLLPGLLKALGNEMNREAAAASQASETVRTLLDSLRK